jgi:hypothetical protein
MIVLLLVLIAVVEATRRLQDFVASSSFSAGVAKVDSTPPVGVPLAGYNHGARRVPYWPLPSFARYTTWMTPSKGRMPNDGIFVRALVMKDSSGTAFAMVTLDGIGSDGTLNAMAFDIAKGMGFTLPVRVLEAKSSLSNLARVSMQIARFTVRIATVVRERFRPISFGALRPRPICLFPRFNGDCVVIRQTTTELI